MKHFWEMKNGEEIEISKMETSHIQNCIAMLERNAKAGVKIVVSYGYHDDDNYMTGDVETLYGKEYLAQTKYKWLKKELARRKPSKIISSSLA